MSDTMPDRAKDLFDGLVEGGDTRLQSLIEDRKSEELFLDFKRSSDNGSGARLSQTDRNNLSKAISGFGNSAGGVIVWGVDCSVGADGADVPQYKVPIQNPARFRGWIEGAVSGSTIPPHRGVRSHFFETSPGIGIVVTYIPRSDDAPHQMLPRQQYYIRAGSDFVPTPHDVLAGMFGRRPAPHVWQTFLIPGATNDGGACKTSIGIAIHNGGHGIAQDVFITAMVRSTPGPNCEVRFENPDKANWTGTWAFGRKISMIAASQYRLPPGVEVLPLTVHLTVSPPIENELLIEGTVGASGSPRHSFTVQSPAKKIAAAYTDFLALVDTGALVDDAAHGITVRLFGGEPGAIAL